MLEIEDAEKVKEIMLAFDNDYEMLARHIKVIKNQIKIRRPETLQSPDNFES